MLVMIAYTLPESNVVRKLFQVLSSQHTQESFICIFEFEKLPRLDSASEW